MTCFLTSNSLTPDWDELNTANGFVEELGAKLPRPCRALFVSSDPNGWEKTDRYAEVTRASFEKSGFRFDSFITLDGRNRDAAEKLVTDADLIILAGGHVPTQNRFFAEIGLKSLLEDFPGVIIGISAGSMNSAETVYAQPELEGEATDPEYRRFLPGLGLTKTMLLPHYHEVKDTVLDGLRVFEDITYPDSAGREFYAIPNGSYLLVEPGKEELRGEAYIIRNGVISQLTKDGETLSLLELRREKSCGAVVYRVEKGERFYLIERMAHGHVSIPKGHVEGNETESETAIREIKEETNLDVELDTGFRRVISFSPRRGCVKDVVFFAARAVSDDMKNQESEVSGLEWLPYEDACRALTYDSDRETLRKVREYLEKRK